VRIGILGWPMIVDRRSLHAHRTTRWRQLSQNLETSSGTRMMNCITLIGLMHRASPVTPLRLCCILVYLGHSVFRGDNYGTVHQSWQHNRDTSGRAGRTAVWEEAYGFAFVEPCLRDFTRYANCLLKFLPMANRLNTNEAALCKLQ